MKPVLENCSVASCDSKGSFLENGKIVCTRHCLNKERKIKFGKSWM